MDDVMKPWQLKILLDLKILDPKAETFTAFTLWGAFLRDPIIRQRLFQVRTGYVDIVAAMTAKEKDDLRARILGRYGVAA
jgi:hypothetical protein